MKQKAYNILIIDDHPIISEAYKMAFDCISDEDKMLSFKIDIVSSCKEANDKIKSIAANKGNIDLVFLDIRLPPSKEDNILSGEDLGILINTLFPDSKIIISTSLSNNFRVHALINNINPDGFLIKNDINSKELITAIKEVMDAPPYYSKTILQFLRKRISNDYLLDKIDRQILFELSMGTKMKDLPNTIPLSLAGIEKRKRHIKQIFNIIDADDRQLLLIAKEKGFI